MCDTHPSRVPRLTAAHASSSTPSTRGLSSPPPANTDAHTHTHARTGLHHYKHDSRTSMITHNVRRTLTLNTLQERSNQQISSPSHLQQHPLHVARRIITAETNCHWCMGSLSAVPSFFCSVHDCSVHVLYLTELKPARMCQVRAHTAFSYIPVPCLGTIMLHNTEEEHSPTYLPTHPPTHLPCGKTECSANESEGVGPFTAATGSCLKELRGDEG